MVVVDDDGLKQLSSASVDVAGGCNMMDVCRSLSEPAGRGRHDALPTFCSPSSLGTLERPIC